MTSATSFDPSTRPAVVTAYLGELEARLESADPAERSDVLAAVREHVDVRLGALDDLDDGAAVAEILDELGPAEVVVAALDPVRLAAPDVPVRTRRRRWIPVVASLCGALSVSMILVAPIDVAPFALVAFGVGLVGTLRRYRDHSLFVVALVLGSIGLFGAAVGLSTNVNVGDEIIRDEVPHQLTDP